VYQFHHLGKNPYCFSSTCGTSSALPAEGAASRTGTSSTTGLGAGTSSTAGSGRPTSESLPACWDAKNAKPRLVRKKTPASIAVSRLKKLEEPWLPNTVAEAPAPKDAPASAPLPCCSSTSTTTPMATSRCTTITTVCNI